MLQGGSVTIARPAWLDEWSRFATDLTFEALPQAVVERGKQVLFDCIGAIAAGAQEPEVVRLTDKMLIRGANGEAPVIGAHRRAAPGAAAFLNGLSGTMLEIDEGNQFARGHPGIHVLPAALAAAGERRASGRELVVALTLGYEIGSRIGIASKLRVTMHPHGTWGTVGAAVAVARLNGATSARGAGDDQRRLHARPRHQPAHDARGRYGAQQLRRLLQRNRTARLGHGGGGLCRRDRRGRNDLRRRGGGQLPARRDGRRTRPTMGDRAQLLQAPRRVPIQSRRDRRSPEPRR